MIEMKVTGLTIDPFTDMPIIILKDLSGKRAIPIWIGLIEASAIATELEKIQLSRPMTHDLMCHLIEKLGGKVLRVELNDLRQNTFYASVFIQAGAQVLELDSRPSDAIALALRSGSQILVAPRVVDRAERIDLGRVSDPSRLAEPGTLPSRGRAAPSKRIDDKPARSSKSTARLEMDPALFEPSARQVARRSRRMSPMADSEVYRALLESLKDEDFGKWKM